MRHRIYMLLLSVLILSWGLCGCGNADGTDDTDVIEAQIERLDELEVDNTVAAVPEEEQEVQINEENIIKLAYVGVPANEIVESARELLQVNGYSVRLIKCENYAESNDKILAGEADASLCINEGYLTSYNKINNTDLCLAQRIYFEPMGIFAGSCEDINHIPDGAKVAVAAGDINLARAMFLMKQKGAIDFDSQIGFQVKAGDITSNPHNIVFEEIEVTQNVLDSTDYALYVMDLNTAVANGYSDRLSIGKENRNSELVDYFSVGIVTTAVNKEETKIKALIKGLRSEEVREYIEKQYSNCVVGY